MTSIRESIRQYLKRPSAAALSDAEIAERVLEMGDEYDWRDAALELLPDAVWAIRRSIARETEHEQAARLAAASESPTPPRKPSAETPWVRDELDAIAADKGYADWDAYMADDEKRQLLARERIARESEERRRKIDERFKKSMDAAMAPWKAAMNFTAAFLNSEFAVGDGRRVTWGDATAADHAARIDMMTARVESMEDTISLHSQVLAVLESTGAETLRQARLASQHTAAA